MKRLILYIYLMLFSLFGYSQTRRAYSFYNGQSAFIVSDDGISFGVENTKGDIIVPKEKKSITFVGNLIFCEGKVGESSNTYALYNYKGECLVNHKKAWNTIQPKKVGEKEWIFCCKESDYCDIYNHNGSIIYRYKTEKDSQGFYSVKDLISNRVIIEPGKYTDVDFSGDFILVKWGQKQGVLKLDGSIIIPPKRYGTIIVDGKYFTRGFRAYFSSVGSKGTCAYYNSNGKCVFVPQKYVNITQMDNGLYRVVKDGRAFIVDSLDNVKISTKYQDIGLRTDKEGNLYYLTLLGGQYGKLDINGAIIEEPKLIEKKVQKSGENFSYIELMNNQGLYGISNAAGKILIQPQYEVVAYKEKGHKGFILRKNGYEGFADINGNTLIPCDKYNFINVGYPDLFIVEKDGRMGICNNNGVETVPPIYDNITELNNLIIAQIGLMRGVIDQKGNVLLPFNFTKIRTDEETGNYNVDFFGKTGIYDRNSKIIVPPVYDKVYPFNLFIWGNELTVDGPFDYYYNVSNGEYKGIYTLDGQMLFPADKYKNVSIGKGDVETRFQAEWFIEAYNDRTQIVYYYDFNGNLLYEEKSNSELFDKERNNAVIEYRNKDYKKSIEYCDHALSLRPDGLVYYYKGNSLYHLNKIKDAQKCFAMARDISKNESFTSEMNKCIDACEDVIQYKKERNMQIIAGILGGIANIAANAIAESTSHKTKEAYKTNAIFNGGNFKRDTSYDYLLDPRLAWMQVQQEEWTEYLQSTNGGRTMTIDQWRILKGQAIMESKKNGQNVTNSTSSDSYHDSNSSIRMGYTPDCTFCVGTGDCKTCEGRGYYYSPYDLSKTIICPNCENHNGKCSRCRGTGKK